MENNNKNKKMQQKFFQYIKFFFQKNKNHNVKLGASLIQDARSNQKKGLIHSINLEIML